MRIKLLALIEAGSLTGPAKNLIEFCRQARHPQPGLPVIDTTLVTFHRAAGPPAAERDEPPNAFVAAARDAGIEIDVIPERFRYDPRAVAELRQVIARRAPDVVETKSVKSHFMLRLAGVQRERPWVAFHHGYTATDLKMRAYNQLDRWSLRAADRVVTVCGDFARDLARRGVGPERISVLHNSIDPDYGRKTGPDDRRVLRSALAVADDERVVLTAGRLSREKAQLDLVKAFAHIRRGHPELKARLVIVGEGPERGRIEAAAVSWQVADRVVLAGASNEVARWYRAADLFALPSLSEGSPNVLLEAMLMELPIVATAVGGVPEIVAHEESALLVRPGDPPALAGALARLLTQESLARGLAATARSLALNNYSPAARWQTLSELYRQAVAARNPGFGREQAAAAG